MAFINPNMENGALCTSGAYLTMKLIKAYVDYGQQEKLEFPRSNKLGAGLGIFVAASTFDALSTNIATSYDKAAFFMGALLTIYNTGMAAVNYLTLPQDKKSTLPRARLEIGAMALILAPIITWSLKGPEPLNQPVQNQLKSPAQTSPSVPQ